MEGLNSKIDLQGYGEGKTGVAFIVGLGHLLELYFAVAQQRGLVDVEGVGCEGQEKEHEEQDLHWK